MKSSPAALVRSFVTKAFSGSGQLELFTADYFQEIRTEINWGQNLEIQARGLIEALQRHGSMDRLWPALRTERPRLVSEVDRLERLYPKLSLHLPFGLGGVEIEVSDAEAGAAWELYVELATRVSAVPRVGELGSIREALDSLHSLFETTREVLRSAGPDVARRPDSLGPLAIEILNRGVRPFLSEWHGRYSRDQHDAGEDWDEYAWSAREEFRNGLEVARAGLAEYVAALADIAGITDRPVSREP